MNKEQQMVKEFHERFGVYAGKIPDLLPDDVAALRIDLIKEEVKELEVAYKEKNLVEVADALGDILYVIYGTAISHGIDLEPIFAEIHRSNMSKGDPEIIKREDGKILKAKNYVRPNLKPIIDKLKTKENVNKKISVLECPRCKEKGTLTHERDNYGCSLQSLGEYLQCSKCGWMGEFPDQDMEVKGDRK